MIMKSNKLVCGILLCLFFSANLYNLVESLIWSRFTLFQVVCCVSWPIPYKNPLRKLFFNVGFQFNYGEPFALSNFYNATYYQNIFNSRDFHNGHSPNSSTENAHYNDGTTEYSTLDTTTDGNMVNGRVESRSIDGLVGKDVSAAQLYESIEDNFVEIGYDKSCLKKAICELARHPLHKEDDEEHLLMDIVNFVFTPTEHNGFAEHETYERQKYETAQKIGENGHDCDAIYPECENSILNKFSYLLTG
ncbi:uncharacterized protein LOC129575584 [Sitodiplosis mosellana]|uniref:uncharacterized protein LOC129575584 n=1 Tax=Sitodiplosis mosellana TaxID=263140 RepID=UPI002443B470|nr:uncharacterized protein LOC129575584 [Sitodiplosis mosellana]